MRRLACVLLVLVLVLAGCDPGFEKVSIVKDARVLALRSEPAEVVVPSLEAEIGEVDIEVLWADPADGRPRPWTLKACAIRSNYNYGMGQLNEARDRCEDDVIAVPLAAGSALPGEAIRAKFRADVAQLARARQLDPLKGFDGQVTMVIEVAIGAPEDPLRVYGQKRVTYSLPLPEGKRANQNPRLLGVMAGGADLVDGAGFAPGQKLALLPVAADDAAEMYRVLTFTSGVRELQETIRYSWFATRGEFTREQTGGAPRVQLGDEPREIDTEWQAPEEPGPVQFWFVIRDERGGTSWMMRQVEVR